jgi:hypothetical protein
VNTNRSTTTDDTAEQIWRLAEIIAFAKKIHSSLDIDVVIAHFLDVAMSELEGESAAIFLIDEEKNSLVLRQSTGTADVEGAETALRHIVTDGMPGETPEAVPSQHEEMGYSRPRHPQVDHYSSRNLLAFPLQDESGFVIGLLQVATTKKGSLKRGDITFLKQICHFSALAIKNAQYHHDSLARARMARELELASQIQRRLVPQEPPKLPGLDVRSFFEPCYEMAGDYCHFFDTDHHHVAVLMDVSGKGVGAAMVASTIHTFLSKFGTECVEQFDSTDFPLGLFADSAFEEKSLLLAPGELLCAYSDGYTEAMNEQDEQFGDVRLRDSINAVRNRDLNQIIDQANEDVRCFRGRAAEQDDKTIILLRKTI